MLPLQVRLLIAVLPLGSAACVETATYERTASQLEEVKRTSGRKDEEIRAYQWQTAALSQQLREAQARSEALQRELYTQVQQLSASNAALAERLKKVESEKTALALAADPLPSAHDGKPVSLRPEDLRRMLAASEAKNAVIVEQLGRIERLLGAQAGGRAHPAAEPRLPASQQGNDVVDPWGFSSRK